MARNEDISIRGSRVDAAGAVGLSAARDVKLAASQDTQINQSQNLSSGYSVGVSANAGKKSPGVTLDLAANIGKGKGNAESVAYANSHLTGGQAVYVQSGRDTELAGATVDAPHISMSAGRDLTLSSLQDWSTSRSVQRNIGVSASIAIYGPATSNVSASFARSTSNSDYLGVNEQTAVRAGVGGFDILVGAHTALNGAVIASAAAPAHNSLITGTLSTTDLANRFDASAESRGLTLSSSMFDGKYQTIKSVTGNLLNNGNAEAHDQSRTLSAISGGNVVIRDEVGQVMRSGQSAQATVANLLRDTSATHRSLEQVDVGELTQEARREQADNMLAFSTLTAFTDEAYRRAFVDAAKLYKIERNEENEPVYVEVAQADWLNLEKGDDGKVHVSNNGIFNTLEDASKNALQNSAEYRGPQYLIYFPQSDNLISELMIAGYMKSLENGIFGLTNATRKTVDVLNEYGNAGVAVSGHSRGGMTVGNALEYIRSQFSSTERLTATEAKFFGSAYNANAAAENLSNLSGGKAKVTSQVHFRDFVGTVLGGNESTGGTTKEGWTRLGDLIYMFLGKETVHNCYGSGGKGCRVFWNDGVPETVIVGKNENENQ